MPHQCPSVQSKENLRLAEERFIQNRGAPGLDGMTVNVQRPFMEAPKNELVKKISDGKY
ncbi:MAG: hypothetical protein LBF22_02595 [Deltaproteobacteria bacterium]|nr:hypothetical protein [Deltaproteobacteria bacterium]